MNIRALFMADSKTIPLPDSNDFTRAPELAVFNWLDQHHISHKTVKHTATHTVAESSDLKNEIPGGHTKNLFLKDKKGQIVLISAWAHSELRLNQLHKQIDTQRLSFANPQLLWDTLKVTPGSVSAFGLIHDTHKSVKFLVDEKLLNYDTINFHPLRNDMTTSISQTGFSSFLKSTGRTLECVDFEDI